MIGEKRIIIIPCLFIVRSKCLSFSLSAKTHTFAVAAVGFTTHGLTLRMELKRDMTDSFVLLV